MTSRLISDSYPISFLFLTEIVENHITMVSFFRLLQAGIPGDQLLIALEPEAASIYCQHLPIEKLQGAGAGFTMARKGTKFMIIDLGGIYF